MNEFQREVLNEIKKGIDHARHEGVFVLYPAWVEIDGERIPWPFERLAHQTEGEHDG